MRPQISLLAVALGISLCASASAAIKPEHASTATRATQFVKANPTLGALSAGDVVTPTSVVEGPNGTRHVRFQRSFGGLPIIGGDFVVHTWANGQQSVTSALKSSTRPASLSAAVTRDSAIVTAGALFPASVAKLPTARLVLLAREGGKPTLAYEVRVVGTGAAGEPLDRNYYIDAASEQVVFSVDNIHTQRRELPTLPTPTPAAGTGHSLYLGQVPITTKRVGGQTGFLLEDPTRGNGAILDGRNRGLEDVTGWAVEFKDADNVWGSGNTSNRQTVAVDAYYGIAATWDYYKEVHNRNGIFDDGGGVRSYVHVGFNWPNAAWDPNARAMYFGNGEGRWFKPLVMLDVAGHEMSHGVITATANLTYSGESGGLNEATADIFGTMVERHSAQKLGRSFNWTMGEDAAGPELWSGTALRYLLKPSLDRGLHPSGEIRESADCYYPEIGTLDVHYSSGVGNHFFYLLSEGATVPAGWDLQPADLVCNGNTALTGIGADAAADIWYLALTAYFTTSTNFSQARVGTLQAAADLFGEGSPQQLAVAASWDAVSVE